MSEVAIIGCGPAGLMAALAVERNGHRPHIFSIKHKSVVHDDMFLQKPLPGHHTPVSRINYLGLGTREGYAAKLYDDPQAPVSWDTVKWGVQDAWWLAPIYDLLWDRFKSRIRPGAVDGTVATVLTGDFPLVISTIPAIQLCQRMNEHLFVSKPVWLARSRSDHLGLGELVYNGDPESKWYRYSFLNGWNCWEFADLPLSADAPGTEIFPGAKLISNTCDCHPRVHRVGRWAQYQRGILNHHAFEQTTSILATEGLGLEG